MQDKIAYCSPFIPPEWIAAHGFIPGCIIPEGIDKPGPIPNTEGVCAFMHCFINEVVNDPDITAFIVTTACDQMRRGADFVRMYTSKPVFLIHIPKTWRTASSIGLYISELKRLGNFLRELGGCEPSNSNLLQIMENHEKTRNQLNNIRLNHNFTAFLKINTEFLRSFRLTDNISLNESIPKGRAVALLGGPLCKKDFELIDVVEEAGGNIVLDGTEFGERCIPAPFNKRRVSQDPLMELAEAYFGTIPDVFRQPNSELFKWLKREIVKRDVKGIILLRYVWCDFWHSEVGRLREWLSIPLIDIDLNMEQSTLRNKMRIQAFMESLR